MLQISAVRRFSQTSVRSRIESSQPNIVSEDEGRDKSIEGILSKPTWSVASLLPSATNQADVPSPITSAQLHHLLRLSALPPPASTEEEKSMMSTLAAQLHFVKEMQKVNTTGVEPLRAIRDETLQAEKEQEITLDTLSDAMAQEEVVGKFYRRIRRKPDLAKPNRQPDHWDPLQHSQKKSGKFFVVNSSKGSSG